MALRMQVLCFECCFCIHFHTQSFQTYYKWLHSVLLSSLLKFWALVLNYKCPNKCVFTVCVALFVIFLNFLWWNLPKFLQHIASSGIPILNTKKVGFVKAVFSSFQIYVFYRCKKSGLIDFPKKQAPTKVKYLLPICQILRNFTEGNVCEKIHCQFCFLCSCWRQKISKNTEMFSFECTQITWAFILNVQAIVKL